MTRYAIVKEGQKPTKRQIKEIEALKNIEPNPDEENPEISYEDMERFRLVAIERRKERQKQVLTLRVSAETMRKAKSLGKGYTGILSRLLEMALNDPDMIEKCL
ncbi:MAG: BrnA antitoxin family protein [Lachnospiraceae bacterium]|nr:BrnA antitoxin family protein [Lachnospiraceae bacterium]